MELQNFDNILARVPKMPRPMRVILAGSDGENMLRGLFQIPDACGVRVFFNDSVKCIFCHHTLIFMQPHAL